MKNCGADAEAAAKKKLTVDDWQQRLEDNFTHNAIVGGQMLEVYEYEREYGVVVASTFKGYIVLTDSFFSFFLDTLLMAEQQFRREQPKDLIDFAPVLLTQAANFRVFRAAEILLINGYPLAGYRLLRDLKDQAIFLAAIISGISTYRKLSGLEEPKVMEKEDAFSKIKGRRKKEQHTVLSAMIRENSGLDAEDLKELRRWEDMFNHEIHGAVFSSLLNANDWAIGNRRLPVFPQPDDHSIAMYLNRSHEVAWMFLRTLPYLQLGAKAFGEEWAKKWEILDDSFRQAVEALKKKISDTIVRVVDVKFPFNPSNTSYREQST